MHTFLFFNNSGLKEKQIPSISLTNPEGLVYKTPQESYTAFTLNNTALELFHALIPTSARTTTEVPETCPGSWSSIIVCPYVALKIPRCHCFFTPATIFEVLS